MCLGLEKVQVILGLALGALLLDASVRLGFALLEHNLDAAPGVLAAEEGVGADGAAPGGGGPGSPGGGRPECGAIAGDGGDRGEGDGGHVI